MNLAGDLRITLRPARAGLAGVDVVTRRPQAAAAALRGRTPAEAAELAGVLFSLCGRAQRGAALAACEAALECPAPVEEVRARHRDILIECAREHAWHLLLRWPETLGQAADRAGLQTLQRARGVEFVAALDAALERLLGCPARAWLHGNARMPDAAAALLAPLRPLPSDSGDMLPPLSAWRDDDAERLALVALDDAAFSARPSWRGRQPGTGAAARLSAGAEPARWGDGALAGGGARVLARLVELAQLAERLDQRPAEPPAERPDAPPADDAATLRAWRFAPGVAAAAVETARGILFHAVRLDGGRVDAWRIIAPTDWNFHPAGPAARVLAQLPDDAQLATRAQRVVLAFDPCVAWEIGVIDA